MKVTPLISNLDKPIKVDLGKRLEFISENIIFKCPECDHKMELLDDPADLEYGSFFGFEECHECGVDFETYNWEVKATVTISKKEK